MKNPLEFLSNALGLVLMALAMVGLLHLAAVMESTALKQQDTHHEHSHDR